MFIVNNLFKYLTLLHKLYPDIDRQQIYDGINNAFKFSQIEMNRLVINFLEQTQNKLPTNLRNNNFYQIRSLSGLVHLSTVEILKSNNKSLLDNFLIFFKKFIDLIYKEIELYISLYKKNDHKAIEKFIEDKNSCVALFFIDSSFNDASRKINKSDLQAILSQHRSLYNYCMNLSDKETLFDYHCKTILSDKNQFLQISSDDMGSYPSPFFDNQIKLQNVTKPVSSYEEKL